jgi:hypothetical protein
LKAGATPKNREQVSAHSKRFATTHARKILAACQQFGFLLPGPSALIWVLSMAGGAALAQFPPPETAVARSVSGQFIVRAEGVWDPRSRAAWLTTNRDFVRLVPTLAAVSAERIRQDLLRELGDGSPWQGKIFLALRQTDSGSEPITLSSERFGDGWQYRVDLPEVIERGRYVRAMVNILLLEVANRAAGERSAEVPLWLVEGFSEQLLAEDGAEIILPPPDQTAHGVAFKPLFVNARRESPLKKAHQVLEERQPLAFDELSWPEEKQVSGDEAGVYRASAQLFVSELLRLDDGRACLRAMLAELPKYYNWQLAFLHAFRLHFLSIADTEKWWALQSAHFTGRELDQTWPLKESLEKLGEALHTPVEEPLAGTNEVSTEVMVDLQTIIRQWEGARQIPALQAKARELEILRLRLARELLLLEEGYRQAVFSYLQSHSALAAGPESKKSPRLDRAARETIKALDALDKQREAMRPVEKGLTSAEPTVAPASNP